MVQITLWWWGNSKNSHVSLFNFAILLKSQKFDAHEIYSVGETVETEWNQQLTYFVVDTPTSVGIV